LKNAVFWDAFTAVSVIILSGTLCHVVLDRTDVSENIVSIFRIPHVDMIPQLCYHEVAVDHPPHRGTLFIVSWDAFTAISITDAL
jgi:hypothetical protein